MPLLPGPGLLWGEPRPWDRFSPSLTRVSPWWRLPLGPALPWEGGGRWGRESRHPGDCGPCSELMSLAVGPAQGLLLAQDSHSTADSLPRTQGQAAPEDACTLQAEPTGSPGGQGSKEKGGSGEQMVPTREPTGKAQTQSPEAGGYQGCRWGTAGKGPGAAGVLGHQGQTPSPGPSLVTGFAWHTRSVSVSHCSPRRSEEGLCPDAGTSAPRTKATQG